MDKQSKWKKILITTNLFSVIVIISIIMLHNFNTKTTTLQQEPTELKEKVLQTNKTDSIINIEEFKLSKESVSPTKEMELTVLEEEKQKIQEKTEEKEKISPQEDEKLNKRNEKESSQEQNLISEPIENYHEHKQPKQNEKENEIIEDELKEEAIEIIEEEPATEEETIIDIVPEEKEPTISELIQSSLPSGYTASNNTGSTVNIFSDSIAIGSVGYGHLALKSFNQSDIFACASGAVELGANSTTLNSMIKEGLRLKVGQNYTFNGYFAEKVSTSNIIINW